MRDDVTMSHIGWAHTQNDPWNSNSLAFGYNGENPADDILKRIFLEEKFFYLKLRPMDIVQY